MFVKMINTAGLMVAGTTVIFLVAGRYIMTSGLVQSAFFVLAVPVFELF